MEDSHINSVEGSQKFQRLSSSPSVFPISSSETTSTYSADDCLVKDNKSSTSGSCNGTSRSSKKETARNTGILKMSLGLGKRPTCTQNSKCITVEDSQDPFAFDEYEFEPSKWDSLSRGKHVSRTQECIIKVRELKDVCQLPLVTSLQEPNNWDGCHSCEIASSPVAEEEHSGLLADCLLTAVKVLLFPWSFLREGTCITCDPFLWLNSATRHGASYELHNDLTLLVWWNSFVVCYNYMHLLFCN